MSSSLTPEEVAAFEAEAARVAADDYEPVPPPGADDDQTDPDEFLAPWLPELTEIARGRGRPSLSGEGPSPARMVRLPASLDAELTARATAEGRPMSALVRDAVSQYLRAG
ncbi:MAG: ribbon-helix-helix domain-containing protein [Micrococcales bacterium]|nr:ribbon-helix-helix domain-containing protein [Micrococcales bacterium]